MLTLLTNTATHTGSAMVTVSVDLGTETAAVAPAKEVPAESPSGASEPTTFTATTTTNAPPAAPSVDTAIHQFMMEHTDFQIIKLNQEVIIYDPSLTPSNVQNAEQETFSFADGSSVMLIGLPHHSAATIGV